MDSQFSPNSNPPVPDRVSARLLTAFIGIPIVLLLIWCGGIAFRLLCLGLALIAMREIQGALRRSDCVGGAQIIGIAAYPAIFWVMWRSVSPHFAFALLGLLLTLAVLFYGSSSRVTLPSLAMTLLATFYVSLFSILPAFREVEKGAMLYLLLFSVWASDTAAYYGGRAFGQTPFSALSPGKTREGALLGALAAIFVAILIATWAGLPVLQGVILGVIIAVCAPLGDLAESFWKRELGVKDIGTIFPGHGGVLDRCDSLLFAALGLSLYFAFLS